MKIKFFTTGGTIDKVYFDALSDYKVGDSNIKSILKHARVCFDFSVSSILKKDSLDLTDKDRQQILNAVSKSDCTKIIITHGTDTMIESAKILSGASLDKVIVFTGAMEPSRFKTSDAVFNLGFSAAAVQTLSRGVYICANGRIFSPEHTVKNRSTLQFEERASSD